MKTKILVVYNPMAGSKLGGNVKKMIQNTLEEEEFEYDFFETIKADKQPLDQFAHKKYDKVIVSGGDGTVAEVASFLIQHKIKSPLIIIPQGSANILAISLKISLNPKTALLNGLKNKGKPLDAMKINDKHYGMIATGLGYDALIMQQTSRGMKRRWGALAYVWTILKTIFVYRGRPYKINIDGKRTVVYAKALMTLNILPLGETKMARYFVGSEVLPNDGLLNIVALNPRPISDSFFIRRRMKVFSGKKIVIQQKESRTFQIDGNVFKSRTVTIEVLPKAVYIAH